jgi:hypothetical protein
VDGLTLSIGVVVGFWCLYALRTVIRLMKGRRAIGDETRLDALRKIDQAR